MGREYISSKTGEIVNGITGILKAEYINVRYYSFIDLTWKRFV